MGSYYTLYTIFYNSFYVPNIIKIPVLISFYSLWQKLKKTGLDRFNQLWSWFFDISELGNWLRLPIAHFWVKKPDQTRPANTICDIQVEVNAEASDSEVLKPCESTIGHALAASVLVCTVKVRQGWGFRWMNWCFWLDQLQVGHKTNQFSFIVSFNLRNKHLKTSVKKWTEFIIIHFHPIPNHPYIQLGNNPYQYSQLSQFQYGQYYSTLSTSTTSTQSTSTPSNSTQNLINTLHYYTW